MLRTCGRISVVPLLLLLGCSSPSSGPEVDVERPPVRSIADLEFDDPALQEIATTLVAEARQRGIHESAGATRVERLLALEGMLGRGDKAMRRVEALVERLTFTDGSQWAKLRRRTENDFARKDDDVADRVNDFLRRWKRERYRASLEFLSSNYGQSYITSLEWERRFAAFVEARPMDAATWGWLVEREHRNDVAAQYGEAGAESAYRYYLEFSGLGTKRIAERAFSVPGIAIRAKDAR